jgi:hypothetical protein
MEPQEEKKVEKVVEKKKRPVLLSALCIFSYVFFGVIGSLFFAALLSARWITRVVDQYEIYRSHSDFFIILNISGGVLLHWAAFAGTILIWRMKKTGYYMLSVSCLIIAIYQLFHNTIPISSTLVYIGLVILFGFYFRKLH